MCPEDHFVCFVSGITARFSAFNSFGREKRACDRALKASADRSDFSPKTGGSILFAEKNLHLVVLFFSGKRISITSFSRKTDPKTQPLSRFYSIVINCAEFTPQRKFCQELTHIDQGLGTDPRSAQVSIPRQKPHASEQVDTIQRGSYQVLSSVSHEKCV